MSGPHFETSAVGTIVLPPGLPAEFSLFYTTADFDGRLDGDAVERLTSIVRQRHGFDATLSTCHQVHSAVARRAGRVHAWCEFESCDALFSSEPKSALGIKVADCLPVSLIDQTSSVIANIHAGWRGTAAGIVINTIDEVSSETSFDITSALVYLGPSIRQCCFEVGEEVVTAISAVVDDVELFADRSRGPRPHLDLIGVNTELLLKRGVRREAIWDSGLCTRCDDRFHSYRRSGANAGRNLAIVSQG